MKKTYSHIGLAKLCGWFGITRQAYYQNIWQGSDVSIEEELLLGEVRRIRKEHPRLGTRKLNDKLESFKLEHQIKIGRDALFDLLSVNHLLVRKRKRRIITTQSLHWLRKHPNLIKDFIPTKSNQLWVSDITYWKIETSPVYISLITDAYSHKIVGYHVADSLESMETIQALKMALNNLRPSQYQLIHHSDRGVQYCQSGYVKLLEEHKIKISMTENGDPRENAIAERVNGILKEEYLFNYTVKNLTQAKEVINQVVELYNNDRPHNSISNLTPNFVYNTDIKTEKLWKKYNRNNIREN